MPVRITPSPHQKHDLTIYRKSSYSSPSLRPSFAHTLSLLTGIWSAHFLYFCTNCPWQNGYHHTALMRRVVFLTAACQSTPFVLHRNHFQSRAIHVPCAKRDDKQSMMGVFSFNSAQSGRMCFTFAVKCRHMASLCIALLISFLPSNVPVVI